MVDKFIKFLQTLAPDFNSARFLLAVSGGCDSVALSHLFAKSNLLFDIAHCNFHLRGKESNKEMLYVQNLLFITTQKVFVKEFNTSSIQQQSGKSIEMIARELRYQWFEELGKDYDYIVTAHHANDNIETVLMNQLRGTGLRGMCGIPQKNGKIIRPLLSFSRSDIENYCFEQKLDYCVDSSNLSDHFLRNKIRHNVIPELEKINPNFIDTFSKNSTLFLQQTQFFDAHIHKYKNKILKETSDRVIIDIELLKNIEYKSLVLYEILQPYGFNASDVEIILKSVNAHSGKRFLSETHILIKDRVHLIIEKKNGNSDEICYINSIDEFVNYEFSVCYIDNNQNLSIPLKSNMIYVDADKISFPLTIRKWKEGDSFYPFGMKNKKKISDFFTDIKMDIFEKRKTLLLCMQDEVVWIIGHRADNRFRVDKNTKHYYKITYGKSS